jgi:hypothetical protein
MNEKQTLLQKARSTVVRSQKPTHINDETIELVLAWAKNEVSIGQVQRAIGCKSHATYTVIAKTFQQLVLDGTLTSWLGK